MPTPSRAAFAAGARDLAPILIGIVPFGLIAGIAAVEAGLDTVTALAVSPVVFAGAAQVAAMDLIARGAGPVVVIATALVINSRFAMYSAALAPHLKGLPLPRLALSAYLLSDQAFAVAHLRWTRHEMDLDRRFAYYLGAASSLWACWQAASALGVLVGARLPAAWDLGFAIPLVFLALLFGVVRDRATRLAAATAAVAAVVAHDLPLNLGLLVASLAGIVAGLAAERGHR